MREPQAGQSSLYKTIVYDTVTLGGFAAGRLGVPDDFVGPCVFLASHASDYVTGAQIVIDGGGTSVPMVGCVLSIVRSWPAFLAFV